MNNYKKAQVIILPTENKQNGSIVKYNGNLEIVYNNLYKHEDYIPQHLHIISDDKIKDGDLVYNNLSGIGRFLHKGEFDETDAIVKYNSEKEEVSEDFKYIKKIIATTDKSLNAYRREDDSLTYIPQPSQQFIEQYIESYNKGEVVNDVLVEYNCVTSTRTGILDLSKTPSWTQTSDSECIESMLKINQDNNINIKPFKNSWSREEVEELVYSAMKSRNYTSINEFRNWIKENL